jgi:glyoxylase-like metal-dependent hydrolase (beta-lactamase superfamily II)
MLHKTLRTGISANASDHAVGNTLLRSQIASPGALTDSLHAGTHTNGQSFDKFPTYQNVTTTAKLNGREVKVHALCTGTVAVKTAFRTKKGSGELAKLNILLDRTYTAYLPIWVWVIEHPDGLVVIDTGEVSAISNIDKYLARESWFMRYQFKHAVRFGIREQDELDYQFDRVNLKLGDVALVVLTHLHLDHTDGLRFFPRQEIMVGDIEYRYPINNMPSTYPDWFKPNRVAYQQNRIEVFDQAFPITAAGDLLYVPTPGHTRGHSSVIFRTDDFDILFAGDASYNQGQVVSGELAGVNADYKLTRQTYRNLLDYAGKRKTIYLPTHDEGSGHRLTNREFLV